MGAGASAAAGSSSSLTSKGSDKSFVGNADNLGRARREASLEAIQHSPNGPRKSRAENEPNANRISHQMMGSVPGIATTANGPIRYERYKSDSAAPSLQQPQYIRQRLDFDVEPLQMRSPTYQRAILSPTMERKVLSPCDETSRGTTLRPHRSGREKSPPSMQILIPVDGSEVATISSHLPPVARPAQHPRTPSSTIYPTSALASSLDGQGTIRSRSSIPSRQDDKLPLSGYQSPPSTGMPEALAARSPESQTSSMHAARSAGDESHRRRSSGVKDARTDPRRFSGDRQRSATAALSPSTGLPIRARQYLSHEESPTKSPQAQQTAVRHKASANTQPSEASLHSVFGFTTPSHATTSIKRTYGEPSPRSLTSMPTTDPSNPVERAASRPSPDRPLDLSASVELAMGSLSPSSLHARLLHSDSPPDSDDERLNAKTAVTTAGASVHAGADRLMPQGNEWDEKPRGMPIQKSEPMLARQGRDAYAKQAQAFLSEDDDSDKEEDDDRELREQMHRGRQGQAGAANDDLYDWISGSLPLSARASPHQARGPAGLAVPSVSISTGVPKTPALSAYASLAMSQPHQTGNNSGNETLGGRAEQAVTADSQTSVQREAGGMKKQQLVSVEPFRRDLKEDNDDSDDDEEEAAMNEQDAVYDWCAFDTTAGQQTPSTALGPLLQTAGNQKPKLEQDKTAARVTGATESASASSREKAKLMQSLPSVPRASDSDDDEEDEEEIEANEGEGLYDWLLDTQSNAVGAVTLPSQQGTHTRTTSATSVVAASKAPGPSFPMPAALYYATLKAASGCVATASQLATSNTTILNPSVPRHVPTHSPSGLANIPTIDRNLASVDIQSAARAALPVLAAKADISAKLVGTADVTEGRDSKLAVKLLTSGSGPIGSRPPILSIKPSDLNTGSSIFTPLAAHGGPESIHRDVVAGSSPVATFSAFSTPSRLAVSSGTPLHWTEYQSGGGSEGAEGGDVPATPSVKDTHEVTRKKANLPSTISHERPTTGNWLKSRYVVNNYILLDPLGTGSYAEVRLCKEKTSNRLYALKIIKKEMMKKGGGGATSKFYEDVKAEIAIMKKLNHPNVLRLYEMMDDPKVNKLYLVLEYMRRGDLMHVLKGDQNTNNCQPLSDAEVWAIFRQVTKGLHYLHSQNIVHGDIKPQNLLVGDDGVVKIADFGISKILLGSTQKLLDTAGTPAFMSPEICTGVSYSGQLADIWALGATMYMIRCGQPPFIANSVIQLYYKIEHDPLVFIISMDLGLRHLIEGMLVKDPTQRMSLTDVMSDTWLRTEPGGQGSLASEETRIKYTPIRVSNEEVYHSIRQLQGPQSLHPETNEEEPSLAGIQGQLHSTPSSIEVAASIALAADPDAGIDCSSQTGTTTLPMQVASSVVRSIPQAVESPQREHVVEVPSKSPKDRIVSPTHGKSHLRRQMEEGEEARRAASFSKKASKKPSASSSRKSSRPRASIERIRGKIDGMEEGLGLGLPGISHAAGDQTRTRQDDPSSENSGDMDDGESSTGSTTEDEWDEDVGDGSRELSHTQYNEIMDTLASQHVVTERAQRYMTCPPMQWSSYFPQLGLYNATLSLSAAWSSVQGQRATQEDRVTVIPDVSGLGTALIQPQRYRNFGFFAIFDGHNGTMCASYLQHHLHTTLMQQSNFLTATRDAMIAAAAEVDIEICLKLARDEDNCGATGLYAIVDGRINTLFVANVGDSKAVLSRAGQAVELTREHRPTRPDERARLEAAGGVVHNKRVNGVLAVSRSFGDVEHKGLASSPTHSEINGVRSRSAVGSISGQNVLISTPEVTVDIIEGDFEFTILASDGLWDVLTAQQVVNFVRGRLHEHRNLEQAAKDVTSEALANGSVDNVSVVILAFHQRLQGRR